MTKLPKKQLKELFESIVAQGGAKCGKANPFILEKGNFKCYVFIKNISPAYYPNYPDNSRVQLPKSDRFKKVIESDLDFLILGYDDKNEVFGAWNPRIIKNRLNEKRNVSVYSRFSWQRSIPSDKFVQHKLSNEEKVLLFKKELLNEYFDRYKDFFDLSISDTTEDNIEKSKFNFDDKIVRTIIDPLLKEHKVLQAVSVLKDTLKNEEEYREFSFKDFFKIVNELYQDIHSK